MPRPIEQGESVEQPSTTALDSPPFSPSPLLSSALLPSRSDCENARGVLTETIRA